MKCFTIFNELNNFSDQHEKIFVGAGGGLIRPYKSIFRGKWCPPAPKNQFVETGEAPAAPKNMAIRVLARLQSYWLHQDWLAHPCRVPDALSPLSCALSLFSSREGQPAQGAGQ